MLKKKIRSLLLQSNFTLFFYDIDFCICFFMILIFAYVFLFPFV